MTHFSFIKIITIQIFILILINKSCNFQNTTNNLVFNDEINIANDIDYHSSKLLENFYFLMFNNHFFYSDLIYQLINDKTCLNFIKSLIDKDNYKNNYLNVIGRKLVTNGFFTNSLGGEDECLEHDELYVLFTLNYSLSNISKNINKNEYQHLLFIETLSRPLDICIWNYCKSLKENLTFIVNNMKDQIKQFINFEDLEIININYKDKDKEAKNNEETNKKKDYVSILITFFGIIFLITFIGTISSFYMENEKEKDNLNRNNSLSDLGESYKDKTSYKFLSAFNIVKNSLLLSKKKEPLSNQNSLIELSLIRIIILFFILLAENTFIILKYIYQGRHLLSFLESNSFIYIKIGTISYEFYKIICGVIFGFKFINYYKKTNSFNFKSIIKFIFKFLPFSAIFLIIHFLLQCNIDNIVRIMHENVRNIYISKIMNKCYYCQKDYTNIFNPLIFMKYNSSDFNVTQYDGCFRPTLFSISEFICYIFIILIMIIFLKLKSKIVEIIFFIFNFLVLLFTYFLTPETKELTNFTLSRLFGLSASIATPYLFFPLYFIGFNIGILYYYNKHQPETFNELNINENNYIPFEYCYKLSIYLGRISGLIKNIISYICLAMIIIISSYYTIIIKYKDKIYFKFDYILKFMYVYHGILSGFFFSIFIAIYLSQKERNFFRFALSSDFFVFVDKIAFIFFNIFSGVLRVFHGISILEIHLEVINIMKNTANLFLIICVFSVISAIIIFIPIKWITFFILKGFNFDIDK